MFFVSPVPTPTIPKRSTPPPGVATLRPQPSLLHLRKGVAVLEGNFLMVWTGPASKVEGVKAHSRAEEASKVPMSRVARGPAMATTAVMAMVTGRMGGEAGCPPLEDLSPELTASCTLKRHGRDREGLDIQHDKQGLSLLPTDPIPGLLADAIVAKYRGATSMTGASFVLTPARVEDEGSWLGLSGGPPTTSTGGAENPLQQTHQD